MAVQGAMFNPYMNYYNSYATMGDIYGFDDYNYTAMGNPMSFNNGVFGGYNYQQYYNNMLQMQDFYTQYNLRNIELQRQNEIAINSADAGLKKAFDILNTKIVSSEQEQIIGALENFKNAIRAKYPNATEEQISNFTAQIYSQMSGGTSLTADIQQYGSSSFMQGFKQAIGFGLFADNKTAEENIAEITGQPESRSSQTAKHAGRATGAAAVGAAIGVCFGGPLGAAIGAGVGALGGLIVSKIKG